MTSGRGARRETIIAACGAAMAAVWIALSACTAIAGSDPIVYPAKGQSAEQMEKDKYSCYQWAKGQTGFDPMQAPTATSAPPPQKGGAVRGAARGAAGGAVIGAVAGDAGKGAAIGAASGGVVGGARRRQSEREREEWAQKESAGYEQRRSEYNRAFGACMEGKGYTIK